MGNREFLYIREMGLMGLWDPPTPMAQWWSNISNQQNVFYILRDLRLCPNFRKIEATVRELSPNELNTINRQTRETTRNFLYFIIYLIDFYYQ
jgi:hypothetical protein